MRNVAVNIIIVVLELLVDSTYKYALLAFNTFCSKVGSTHP